MILRNCQSLLLKISEIEELINLYEDQLTEIEPEFDQKEFLKSILETHIKNLS